MARDARVAEGRQAAADVVAVVVQPGRVGLADVGRNLVVRVGAEELLDILGVDGGRGRARRRRGRRGGLRWATSLWYTLSLVFSRSQRSLPAWK
jgi:hypothetical protein